MGPLLCVKTIPVLILRDTASELAQDLPFLDSKRQGTFTQHCFPLSFSGNERECWEFLDWRLASENDSLVPGQPSFLKELLFQRLTIRCGIVNPEIKNSFIHFLGSLTAH